jgi:hypothetical protein
MAFAQIALKSPSDGANPARLDRLFHGAMTLMVLAVVVIGFGPRGMRGR